MKKGISDSLTVSKVERDRFRFTGWDIERFEDQVKVSIKDYANSLKDITEIRKADRNEKFTREEMKEFRKFMGKLSWLAMGTRPNLSYTMLKMSQKGNLTMIAELQSFNKVLKKAKSRESEIC